MQKSGPKAAYWFITGVVLVLFAPIIQVLPDYQTYIHPWRAELIGSVLLIILLAAVFENEDFRRFLAEMPKNEIRHIAVPCAAFIVWSCLSAIWSRSATFALYHTSVWASYLAFYALFRYYTQDEAAIERWIWALMVFLWIIGVPAIFQFYAYAGSPDLGALNLGLAYSKYSELANAVVPLVAAYAIKSKGNVSYIAYATVILVWIFDNGSLSRTGVGMFVIETAALLLLTFVIPSLKPYRAKAGALAAALLVVTAISSAILISTAGNVPVVTRMTDPSTSDSSNIRPFFFNIALEMWRHNTLLGVGADNYGLEFSRYRQEYAKRVPDDPHLALADEDIAERAHNEYAQTLAELGIVGLAIFAAFLVGIAVCSTYLWRARNDISLNTAAALIGVAAFLSSSLVTSYSFRIFQNGIVFFFVLAVAVAGTLGREPAARDLPVSERRQLSINIGFALALIASVLLGGYCLLRVAAIYEMNAAIESKTAVDKDLYFTRALKLDPGNAAIYRARGLTRLIDRDPAGAVQFLRLAMDHGLASTTEYSFMATAQVVGGNGQAASQTIDEALLQFPRSVFLHVRSSVLLKQLGKTVEAEQQYQIARDLDEGQAATWLLFLESGAMRASQTAAYSNGVPLTALRPRSAVAAVQKERELLYPDERMAPSK